MGPGAGLSSGVTVLPRPSSRWYPDRMYLLDGACNYDGPGMVGRWNGDQVAGMKLWTQVGDREAAAGFLKSVDTKMAGLSTVTTVNELMPIEGAWLQQPTADAPVRPINRW